jgi:hypothetical protein
MWRLYRSLLLKRRFEKISIEKHQQHDCYDEAQDQKRYQTLPVFGPDLSEDKGFGRFRLQVHPLPI